MSPSQSNESQALERHTQTVLVLVLVALLLWVGGTTQQTAIKVATMTEQINQLRTQIREPDHKFKEIEKRLDAIEKTLGQIQRDQI